MRRDQCLWCGAPRPSAAIRVSETYGKAAGIRVESGLHIAGGDVSVPRPLLALLMARPAAALIRVAMALTLY